MGLYVNIAISLIAAAGLVVVVPSGVPAALRVWGAWAVVAGLVQLIVALRRRQLGGQWAMIVSGSISTVAGISFFLQAAAPHASLSTLAGYARLGATSFSPQHCAWDGRPAGAPMVGADMAHRPQERPA